MPRKNQANNKTQPDADTGAVAKFLSGIANKGRQADAQVLLDLMRTLTGESPVLWGPSIIGFGSYHYRYKSGREGDGPLIAFSPRTANMVVYIMPGFAEFDALLARLGKHKLGKSCLYLGRLNSIDLDVLSKLITADVAHMRNKYGVPAPA